MTSSTFARTIRCVIVVKRPLVINRTAGVLACVGTQRAYKRGRGGRNLLCLFLKFEEKCSDPGKNTLIVSIYGSKSDSQLSKKNVLFASIETL